MKSVSLALLALAAVAPSVAAQCLVATFPSGPSSIDLLIVGGNPKLGIVTDTGARVVDVLSGDEHMSVAYAGDGPFADIALNQQHVAIGDPQGDFNYAGSVKVYRWSNGNLVNTITQPPGWCDWFGSRLDLDGPRLVASEPEALGPWGTAFFYHNVATATGASFSVEHDDDNGAFPFEIDIVHRGASTIAALAGSHLGEYTVYLYEDYTVLGEVVFDEQIRGIAVAGDLLAVTTLKDTRIFNVDTQALVVALPHVQPVATVYNTSVCMANGLLAVGVTAANGASDVALWDTTDWSLVRRIPAPSNATVFGRDVKLAGEYLATIAMIGGQSFALVYAVPRPTNDLDGNGWVDDCEWIAGPSTDQWHAVVGQAGADLTQHQSRAWGSDLVTVRSQAENDYLLATFAQSEPVWIGYTDVANEGTFVWTSGETPGYENWRFTQPDDVGGADWTLLPTGGQWTDEPASQIHSGVMEVFSPDCNADSVPDAVELASEPTADWNGDGVLDDCLPATYCAVNANSTGQPATIRVSGTPVVAANGFGLHAGDLPLNEFGYFLMSASQAFLPLFAGSAGNLCLGNPIKRFNNPPAGQVLDSGASGSFAFQTDLSVLPQGTVFLPGASWNFQAWYRDGATSNTTAGIAVLFR